MKTNSLYQRCKMNKHVFLFCVAGRSGSTALQRFINSSNELCMWGEPWGIDFQFIHLVQKLNQMIERKSSRSADLDSFINAFQDQNHTNFYPNAFRELDDTVERICNTFCHLLWPVTQNINRFGYKNIELDSSETLSGLTQIFPNAKILFLFRDPIDQWKSVKASGFFSYSNNVDEFLRAFESTSNRYLTYCSREHNFPFVHYSSLYEHEHLRNIFEYIDINSYDKNLVAKVVSTHQGTEVPEETEKICASHAYTNYETMRRHSDRFLLGV